MPFECLLNRDHAQKMLKDSCDRIRAYTAKLCAKHGLCLLKEAAALLDDPVIHVQQAAARSLTILFDEFGVGRIRSHFGSSILFRAPPGRWDTFEIKIPGVLGRNGARRCGAKVALIALSLGIGAMAHRSVRHALARGVQWEELTYPQQSRWRRDAYYLTPWSEGAGLIVVPAEDRKATSTYARARAAHRRLDGINGAPSHHLHRAVQVASVNERITHKESAHLQYVKRCNGLCTSMRRRLRTLLHGLLSGRRDRRGSMGIRLLESLGVYHGPTPQLTTRWKRMSRSRT